MDRFDTLELLAHNIKRFRRMNNLSQRQFAQLVKLSAGTVAEIERGAENLTMRNFEKICRAINVTPQALMSPHDEEVGTQNALYQLQAITEYLLKTGLNEKGN